MTTRREVLQGLIVSLGGASMLSACGGVARVAMTAPGTVAGRFYSIREMALLSRVSELLFPRTDSPGALDVNVPGFLDGLMTDWANAATQAQHHSILVDLEQNLGADFPLLNQAEAEQTLAAFDRTAFEEPVNRGYRSLKGLIHSAYFASAGGALEEQEWVAVPGRWDPCVTLES